MAPVTASTSPTARANGIINGSVNGAKPTPAENSNPTKPPADERPDDSRVVKRKEEEHTEQRLPATTSLGLTDMAKDREVSKERPFSRSPLLTQDTRPASSAAAPTQPPPHTVAQPAPRDPASREAASREPASRDTAPRPASTFANSQASAASRYSIYGPTSRDPSGIGLSSWSGLANRYAAHRKDVTPAASSTTVVSKPTARLSPPRRDPELARESRLFGSTPSSSTSNMYGHYGPMGWRELAEHREQLREGRKWLENMLSKTDKLLSMVENKMALSGESGGASTAAIPASTASSLSAKKHEEWDLDERERARQVAMRKLEEEGERDRVEREKLEKERSGASERDGRSLYRINPFFDRARERPASTSTPPGSTALGAASSASTNSSPANRHIIPSSASASAATNGTPRERSEAERNRDLLLGRSRPSSVVSPPNTRDRAIPSTAAAVGAARTTSAWDSDGVLGGVGGLARRDPTGLRGFGRGLWS